jgi:nucleotide-binding universal stress UspA family protein
VAGDPAENCRLAGHPGIATDAAKAFALDEPVGDRPGDLGVIIGWTAALVLAKEVEAMYKHILTPTDGSELSNKAIRHGVALAKAINAKVTGITVTIPFHVFAADPETITDTPDSYKKRTSAAAAKYLTQVKDAAAAVGITCAVIEAEHEHPYKAIIDAANKNGCGLIVMVYRPSCSAAKPSRC